MKESKTLVYDSVKQYYDKAKNVFTYRGSDYTVPQRLEFNWQIEEQKEPEYMNHLERLEYMMQEHFKGRVVRYDNGRWNIPFSDYYLDASKVENALLKNGEISDIRKFVK